ncbi:acyltransferase family protein [Roseobacter sinensis]|uniref:Acyltransferase family protein n=1 Tax=Roseobacter sinensis TaxID=2931391 RepID=A0ABT3BL43_9RHOB|nr:acyltransferase family protein [Roseobacter sp. WL0113]MCV3274281.1 acyltransferase family protein [Roseobacter sp. WL0113]
MSSPPRRNDVDTLRALVVLLLVPFHTARLFDAEVWHMKDLEAPYWAADFLIRSLNIAQMSLLFLLAGMSAAWALERRSGTAFIRERFARLIIPLLIGIFVLVAPQVLLERITPEAPLRMSPIDHEGGLSTFVVSYFRCCYPEANFSWHHLWFLPYLFAYCLPLALLAKAAPARPLANWMVEDPRRLFLPGLALIGLEAVLRPSFPSTHNLVWDWANHAHYGFLVLFGFWLGRNPELEAAIGSIRRTALILATSLVAIWFVALPVEVGGFGMIALPHSIRHVIRFAAEWCLLLSLLAYGRSVLGRSVPVLRAFVPIALPFYLFHQTIIVLLGWLWLDWSGAPLMKATTIASLATVLSILLAWAAAQFSVTRVATGLPFRDRQRRDARTTDAICRRWLARW